MKLLLTSAGIRNKSIYDALVALLGKPVAESTALCIPTAIYPMTVGPEMAWRFTSGQQPLCPMCELGWKSVGVLELTALPSVKPENWLPQLQQTDVLLVQGGDCQYLCYWMRQSGLAELLPSLLRRTVYVGLSAGSMVMTSYGTTYGGHTLPADGDRALRMLGIAILPHLDHESFPKNSLANLEREAATIPVPSYAIDDETALKVVDGAVEVVTEGHWKLFPGRPRSG